MNAESIATAFGGRKAGDGGIDLNDAGVPDRIPYDLDQLSDRLAASASTWIPQYFPQGRISDDRSELRLANISGAPPRKQGSCVIALSGANAGCWHEFDGGDGGGPLSTLQKATGKNGRELLDLAAEIIGANGSYHKAPAPSKAILKPPRDPSAEIAHILTRSVPLVGTLAETYLKSRRLEDPKCPDLRFTDNVTDWKAGVGRPAMIGIPRLANGEPTGGIHRTYLAYDGGGKANIDQKKKMLGLCRGGAVQLAAPGEVLMVGEGIETCLSAMQATGNPAWAALSTSGLRALNLPDGVRDVIVLADGDDAGEAASRDCARRWKREGRRVRIARPPCGCDFNDMLMGRTPRTKEGA